MDLLAVTSWNFKAGRFSVVALALQFRLLDFQLLEVQLSQAPKLTMWSHSRNLKRRSPRVALSPTVVRLVLLVTEIATALFDSIVVCVL